MADEPVKLFLKDCSDPLQRLIRLVAEQFKEKLIWPTHSKLHLLQQDFGFTEDDFGPNGSSAFAFFFEDQKYKARLNLWALHDTGLFDDVFADARRVLGRAFDDIRRTEEAAIVTRGDIGRQLRRSENDPYLVVVEYVFSCSYFGHQSDPDQGWKLVVDVVRSRTPLPEVDELFLRERPTRSWPGNITKIVAAGAFLRPPLAAGPDITNEDPSGTSSLVDVEYPWEPPSTYQSIIAAEAAVFSLSITTTTWSAGRFSIRCVGASTPTQETLRLMGERVRERLLREREANARLIGGDTINVGTGPIGGTGSTTVAVTVAKHGGQASAALADAAPSGARWKWLITTLIAIVAAGGGLAQWLGLFRQDVKPATMSSSSDSGVVPPTEVPR